MTTIKESEIFVSNIKKQLLFGNKTLEFSINFIIANKETCIVDVFLNKKENSFADVKYITQNYNAGIPDIRQLKITFLPDNSNEIHKFIKRIVLSSKLTDYKIYVALKRYIDRLVGLEINKLFDTKKGDCNE